MSTLKQNLRVNGQVLSNNDVDLVIKLDDHSVVQIDTIQDSSITYKFLSEVLAETTYNLNLTFTYKKDLVLVVPLTFTHNVLKPNLVVTDSPISPSMWERGNAAPFTLTLNGTNVTGSLTNLKIGDNEYVKPDPEGTDVWEVLYSKPAGFDETVSFTYDFVDGGKTWSYTSEGTFKLPAWDGIAFKAMPSSPEINATLLFGQETNVKFNFKGTEYTDDVNIKRSPSNDVALPENIDFDDVEGNAELGRRISLSFLTIGVYKPKYAYEMITPLGGYPPATKDLTLTWWEPTITVSDTLALTQDNTDILPGGVTVLNIKVDQSDKVPVNDGIVKTLNVVQTPNDGTVLTQVGELSPTDTPGVYQLYIVAGVVAGSFTVDAVITVNGVDCPTNKITYNTVAKEEELTVTAVNDPNIVAGYFDDVKLVKLDIKVGDTVIPGDSPDLTYTSTNTGSFTIVNGVEDGVNIKLTRNSDTQVTVNSGIGVSYKGQRVNVGIGVTHNPILELTLDTPNVSGETGDEIIVKMTVKERGVVIPLDTNPLTITYDPGEIFVPTAISSDGVLSTIEQVVTEPTPYVIDVTADWNNNKSAAQKLTLTVSPKFGIVITQESNDDLVPFESTRLWFTLKDLEGNPVVNATRVSIDVTSAPKSGYVVAGYSNVMGNDPDVPGRYYVSLTGGETKGVITINIIVSVPDRETPYTLTALTYNNPGTPVIASPNPATATAILDQVNDINFTLVKATGASGPTPAVGRVTITSVTGEGTLGRDVKDTVTPGTYNFGIKSKGVVGKVIVTGVYNNNSTASIYPNVPFSFEFEYVNDEPVVTGPEEAMTLALWEAKVLSYDVMAGTDNINDTVTDVIITNLADVQEWIELDKDSEGVYSLKAIKAEKDNDAQWYLDITVKGTYLGNAYLVNFPVEVIISANTNNIPENRFNVEFL